MHSKMKTADWVFIYAVTGLLDLIQFGINFLPPFGEGANEIADVIIGVLLGLYFQWKGVSMKKPSRILGLIAVYIGEAFSAGELPLWILDVLLMHITVSTENRLLAKAAKLAESFGQEPPPLNQNGVRRSDASRRPPLNNGPMRLPNKDFA